MSLEDTQIFPSTCPHDCPSTCLVDVEVSNGRVSRIRGAQDNTYTDGVICAKVARYHERIEHPDRLLKPLQRAGAKGDGAWRDISWDAALDEIAERFLKAEQTYGSETVWPYVYAGTMGLVQRDSINRLRHSKRYSNQFDTICINNAWTGFSAATGKLQGPDPREMAKSDCVVIWGTNAVSTQVNVMTHAIKARKERGAKIVAIDIYRNDTMKQADMALVLRPGTDAALACAVMHVLFRDGYSDRDFMARHADDAEGLEGHLASRTPQWASDITGLSVEEIESFARLIGTTKRSYFRLGYGFTRSRNGAVAMHAACCIPTVTGAWAHEGGGAFHTNAEIYHLDKSLIENSANKDRAIRSMDQSKIGRVLTGDEEALYGGPPVTAMLIQNTNPANVAPEQSLVLEGFQRDDLFVAVHEQFMTETAQFADIVLPATMFVEHTDIYRGGGHQHIGLGKRIVDAPGECRTNLFVVEELAKRLGVSDQPGFGLSEEKLIDDMLQRSGYGTFADLERSKWIDCQPSFEVSHFIDGFAHADGKFHFKADWQAVPWGTPPDTMGLQGPVDDMPGFPDHWQVTEVADSARPYRLATSPARSFLNTTFNRTPGSLKREGPPSVLIHPDDAKSEGISEGEAVTLTNQRGAVQVSAKFFDGIQPGTLIVEGLHRNDAHPDGKGINTLVGADATAPHGGAAFHDVAVRIERVSQQG